MSSNGAMKAVTVLLFGTVSWYAGIKFWQPIVMYVYYMRVLFFNVLLTYYSERLRKDGTLRDDVYIPEQEPQPQSWQDVRDSVKATLHPEMALKDDNKFQRDMKKQIEERQQQFEATNPPEK